MDEAIVGIVTNQLDIPVCNLSHSSHTLRVDKMIEIHKVHDETVVLRFFRWNQLKQMISA